MIDAGLDRNHPDLSEHNWVNPDELPSNGLGDDGNGKVDDTWGWDFGGNSQPLVGRHGTQVAGQVAGDGSAGTVTGMAPEARPISLRIDCDTPSRAWAASDYAIAEGADLITQSLGDPGEHRPDVSRRHPPEYRDSLYENGAQMGLIEPDIAAHGSGDVMLDPVETVVMRITVESRTDEAIDGLEAILSSATPGVTIHDRCATCPALPARGAATSLAPPRHAPPQPAGRSFAHDAPSEQH